MTDCLFCKIISGEIPSRKVYEDDEVLAFLDIHPINPGHTLIVPKTHSRDLLDTKPEDLRAVISAVQRIAPAILRAVGVEAFDTTAATGAAAGQSVFHLHFHIIPRFPGDGYLDWHRSEVPADELPTAHEKIRKALEV